MWDIITEIIPNRLYLTGYKGVSNVKQVLNLEIDIIVSATDFVPFKYNKPIQYSNIEIIHYYAEDSEDFDMTNNFNNFCKLMELNPNKKVLIHCLIGASRSASLVVAYLLKQNNYQNTVEDILKLLKLKREIVDPNAGFINQLNNFNVNKFGA